VAPSLHELVPSDHPALHKPRRRLSWLPQRRPPTAPRPSVSPAVVEEEAATLLYGERTGTVHASPVVPPVGEETESEDS
jgi:hypothetical protein